jgi:hypothetical protein
MAPAREQEVAGFPAEGPQVLIEGLPRLLGQFELDGTSGFPLPDAAASDRYAVRGDILDLDADHITAAELAVDRQVEHGEVSDPAIDSEL